jgi:hypothetical protein
MSQPFSYAVRFQIRHPTARAEELVAELPWKVANSWTVGDERATPKGAPLPGTRSESYCNLQVAEGDDGRLPDCLSYAVDTLGAHQDHLAEACRTGGSLSFYVFWYPNGDTGAVFSPDLLGKMASLGIALGLNVYDDRPSPN